LSEIPLTTVILQAIIDPQSQIVEWKFKAIMHWEV